MAPKQPQLAFSSAKAVTQREIKELVAGYVVEEMLPIPTIESPSFLKSINKIPMMLYNMLEGKGTVTDKYLPATSTTFEGLEHS